MKDLTGEILPTCIPEKDGAAALLAGSVTTAYKPPERHRKHLSLMRDPPVCT